jgi:hypothetical protein
MLVFGCCVERIRLPQQYRRLNHRDTSSETATDTRYNCLGASLILGLLRTELLAMIRLYRKMSITYL